MTLHEQEFPLARAHTIPGPPPVDAKAVTRQLQREALSGIPWRQFGRRGDAKRIAAARAPQVVADLAARQQREHDQLQAEADASFNKLVGNDPEAVLSALEAAFEDNQSPAAAIECSGATATIVILFGHSDAVPDRKPAVTPTGKPTLHKRSKTEREEVYLAALSSTILATVREGFACAPGLDRFAVLVVRSNRAAISAADGLEAIYIGVFNRQRLDQLDWGRINCVHEVVGAPGAKINRRGSAGQVTALDVSNEPELKRVLRTLSASLSASAQRSGEDEDDELAGVREELGGQGSGSGQNVEPVQVTGHESERGGAPRSSQEVTSNSAPPQLSPDGSWWWTGV
ncbi:MAG: hypothetical protein J2P43_00325, partial [Candidatus Dormibacteraeota bacterium]|nr:hypothetical protein [Candidatus Dormibacteraeota bacterium]